MNKAIEISHKGWVYKVSNPASSLPTMSRFERSPFNGMPAQWMRFEIMDDVETFVDLTEIAQQRMWDRATHSELDNTNNS